MAHQFNFCPNCATPLQLLAQMEDGGEKARLRCAACAWTHWNNPTPVLAAIFHLREQLQRRRAVGTEIELMRHRDQAGNTPVER